MTSRYVYHQLHLQQMCLLAEKAIFWQDKNTLIVADLHLGKAAHFRKAGIPVPAQVHATDLATLDGLLQSWPVRRLIILGDLFHSDWNSDWHAFAHWACRWPQLQVVLVKGNHDRLPDALFNDLDVQVCPQWLVEAPFVFSHVPLAGGQPEPNLGPAPPRPPLPPDLYCLSGHLHPAVRLRGRGGQSVSLPCFFFGEKQGLLPAFGRFTGTAALRPHPSDAVFAIVGQRVQQVV
jgi:uncharacterized protein